MFSFRERPKSDRSTALQIFDAALILQRDRADVNSLQQYIKKQTVRAGTRMS